MRKSSMKFKVVNHTIYIAIRNEFLLSFIFDTTRSSSRVFR